MDQSSIHLGINDDLNEATYPWKVLGIVMLGTFMAALDSSIVNVSLPSIMADFGASLDDIEWVITGFMLAFATFMPLTAWFRDRIGHKNLYIASLIVFTLGSVLCGMAWNLPSLIVARVIQAIGGGAVTPTGMAMISEVFLPKDRARALGFWGLGVIVGPAFGPTLGGWLTQVFGWRSIFMINLPFGILGTLLSIHILKKDLIRIDAQKPFDFWGFFFLSVFLISFLLGISKGEHEGWTSAYIFSCMAISAFGLIGFLLVESLEPYGIIDLSLFKSKVFSACMAVTAVRSVALYGGTFLLPLFLQQLQGLDEIESGLMLLPGALMIGFVMPMTAKLMDKFGPRSMSITGLLALAYFMFMYRSIDINTSHFNIIFPTLVRGVGMGLLFTPITATALNYIPKEKAGMASSMLNLIQQVGGSIGIASLTTVLSHRVKFHLSNFGSSIDSQSSIFQESFHKLSYHAHSLGYSHSDSAKIAHMTLSKSISNSSSAAGFEDAFLFGVLIILFGIIAAVFLPNKGVKVDETHMAME